MTADRYTLRIDGEEVETGAASVFSFFFMRPFDNAARLGASTPLTSREVRDFYSLATFDVFGSFAPHSLGSEGRQIEELRQAIIAKNELYFHSWRPQNVTYLFGFRKHEQGQNAKETAEFEKLVAAREAEIARLKKPVPHKYELVPAKNEKQTP